MKSRGFFWAASGLAALFGLLYLRVVNLPSDGHASLCATRRFLHFSCPGCGLTRSFDALADGHWLEAFKLHPLGPVIFFQGLVIWLAWGLVIFRILPPPSDRRINQWLFAQLFLLVGVWLVRFATGTLPA